VARQRLGLIGPTAKQRHPFAFKQTKRGFRLGNLLGDQRCPRHQRGKYTATEAAHPEERHRQIQAGVGVDAARRKARLHGAQRVAVGVHDSLGRRAAARGEHDDQRVGGRDRLGHRVDDLAGALARGGVGQPVERPNMV
jgi:hypothetical protein